MIQKSSPERVKKDRKWRVSNKADWSQLLETKQEITVGIELSCEEPVERW